MIAVIHQIWSLILPPFASRFISLLGIAVIDIVISQPPRLITFTDVDRKWNLTSATKRKQSADAKKHQ